MRRRSTPARARPAPRLALPLAAAILLPMSRPLPATPAAAAAPRSHRETRPETGSCPVLPPPPDAPRRPPPPAAAGFARIGPCLVYTQGEEADFDATFGPFLRSLGNLEDFELTNAPEGDICTVDSTDLVDCTESLPGYAGCVALDAGDVLAGIQIDTEPKRGAGWWEKLVVGPGYYGASSRYLVTNYFSDRIDLTFPASGPCAGPGDANVVGFSPQLPWPAEFDVELADGSKLEVSDDAGPIYKPNFLGLVCDVPIARVSAGGDYGSYTPGIDNIRWTATPPPPGFGRSTKTASATAVLPGASLVYTIVVQYSGPGPTGNVTVTDTFPPCLDLSGFDVSRDVAVAGGPFAPSYLAPTLTIALGAMSPGETRTITLTGIRGGAETLSCCNQAFITSDDVLAPGHPTGYQPSNSSPTCVAIHAPSFRRSSKSAEPYFLESSDPLTYTVTVLYDGAPTTDDVVVTDVLPSCLDARGFDPQRNVRVSTGSFTASYAPPVLSVMLGSMSFGESRVITIDGLFAATEPTCCNQAFVTSRDVPAPGDPTVDGSGLPAPTCVSVRLPSFVQSTKSVTPDPIEIGGSALRYTLVVTNSGDAIATGVLVHDSLPACLDDSGFVPGRDVRIAGGGSVFYNRPDLRIGLGTLAPGQSRTITVDGLVGKSETAACCNQAFVTSDQVPAPGHPTGTASGAGEPTCAAVVKGPPTFRLSTKQVAPSPTTVAGPLTYTLTIRNSGGLPATNVTVLDSLPACVDASGFDPARDVSVAGGPFTAGLVWPLLTVGLGTMDAGETRTVTVAGLRGAFETLSCCNQAFVTSDQVPAPGEPTAPPGFPGSPTCVAVGAPLLPDFLSSTKEVTPDPTTRGGALSYRIRVNNRGTAPSTATTVTDTLPACVDASAFDPARDVTVSGGAFTATFVAPTLTVELGTLAINGSRLITIDGLRAGSELGSCCNQAFVASNEVAVGQPTGSMPGTNYPTCVTVATAGCDLLRQVVTARSAPPWVYRNDCSPGDARLDRPAFFLDLPGSADLEPILPASGNDLTLYQLDCWCSGRISLVKNRAYSPPVVHVEY